jgi:HPt (histidine-containing phosphotransfer) domain-containing protein
MNIEHSSRSDPLTGDPVTVLDAAALSRLRELDPDGHRGVLQRVLLVFEASLDRSVTQLSGQGAAPDAAALAALAHTLKSSSASVGALALARACAEVERRLRDAAPGDLRADADRIRHECEAARVAVRAMLRR